MLRLLCTLALAVISSTVTAQTSAAPTGYVYKCTLAGGQIRYTNGKCPDGTTGVPIASYSSPSAAARSTPSQTDPEADLTSHKHYVNHAGEVVHSPSATVSHTVPAGASAICGDGAYSFSRNHRGTCSHHGGVARWL